MKARRIAALLTTLAMVLSLMGAPLPSMAADLADLGSEGATETVATTPAEEPAVPAVEATAPAEPAAPAPEKPAEQSVAATTTSKKVAPAATVAPSAVVCKIGATPYASLDDALAAVATWETITLLQDITLPGDLTLSQGFAYTIDTNGFNLDFDGNGLSVGSSSAVTFTDAAALLNLALVAASSDGWANFAGDLTLWTSGDTIRCNGGFVTVNGNVSASNVVGTNYAVRCIGGSQVVINGSLTSGDVSGSGNGIYVSDTGSTVTVGAGINAGGGAIIAVSGAQVTVTGDVSAASGDAIDAESGAKVTVTGDVSANSSDWVDGVYAKGDGTLVTVTGDISCVSDYGNGIESYDKAVVKLTGNITCTGSENYGIYSFSGSQITVTGNISTDAGDGVCVGDPGTTAVVTGDVSAGGGSAGVFAGNSATAIVNGDVTSTGEGATGVSTWYADTHVTINGNVTSDDIGAEAGEGGQAIVNGTLTAPTYVVLVLNESDTDLTADDFVDPTTLAGYKTYTDDVSTVWVKDTTIVEPTLYSITVLTDGNGTASASKATAAAGDVITLTATPNAGYKFAGWELVDTAITITGNTFVMPDFNVTVKALFEKVDEPKPPQPPQPPQPKPPVPPKPKPKPKPKPPVPPKSLVPPQETGDHSSLTLPVMMLGYALIALTGFYFLMSNRRPEKE